MTAAAMDALFCDSCGARLLPVAASPDQRGLIGSLRRESAAAPTLDTERKQVTVLIGDIAGSTELIAGRDPEEARALLDPVIQAMMDAVRGYGGTVNQILGDGIMALFGAPITHEDHALRACYAALTMHETIPRTLGAGGGEAGTDEPVPVQLHVGLASGEVLVGSVGAELSSGYNAVGAVIHIASRLQHMAEAGVTLCTAETLSMAEGFVEARSVGSMVIRGLREPVAVCELSGARGTRMRFHTAAARGLTPFVGRERETAALQDVLLRVEEGSGEAVALVGDAGIGKSRLVWELTRSPRAASWQILETGCVSFGRDSPYLPIVGLLKILFEIGDRDDTATIARKASERLAALDGELANARPAILSLLGIDPKDRSWSDLDPLRRRGAINAAFVRLVSKESRNGPLIIVVEDLHWVDRETQSLLDALVASLATARILLLVNYRPEYDASWAGWSRHENFTRLEITPLAPGSAYRLVRTMLGEPVEHPELHRELVQRTGGNPFFLEESVRTLIEARVLVGEPGSMHLAGHLAGDATELHVPASVRAVLGARIDRLPPPEKRLLQAAAAIGIHFSPALLSALQDEPPETLQERLTRLKEAGLVYESSLYPELQYSFMHALTQEVAYDSLPHGRRRRLHAGIVQAIERRYAPRIAEQAETLAQHAARGEMWDRLAVHAREAGRRAAARSAFQEAAAHFEQAVDAYARLPRSEATLAEAIDTRFELRRALFPLGEVQRDLDHLRAAEALAQALGDRSRLAWISVYMARDLALLGGPDQALEAGRRGLALAEEAEDAELTVLTRCTIGQAQYALGEFRQTAAAMRMLIEATAAEDVRRRFGLPGPGSVFFRAWQAWSLARLGDAAGLAERAAELRAVAAETEQPLCLTVAHYTHGFALVQGGEFSQAIPALEQAMLFCRSWGFSAWFSSVAAALGYAYARNGRAEAGIDLLWQGIRKTRASGIMASHAAELGWLADACRLAGRLSEAATHARAAVDLARRTRERGNEASALRIAAEIALAQDRADPAAEADLQAALALATACGMAPEIAACHVDLDRLSRRTAMPERAVRLG